MLKIKLSLSDGMSDGEIISQAADLAAILRTLGYKPFCDLFNPTFYLLLFCLVQQRFPLGSHWETPIFY
jgi:hypothetical protein